MIGIDTNVLLAWVLDGQATKLPGNGPYRVSLVVLAEFIWVLGRQMSKSKPEQIQMIKLLLDTNAIRFPDDKIIIDALTDFEHGNADFADCLLMQDNQSGGCLYTLTFDKKAANQPGFRLFKKN